MAKELRARLTEEQQKQMGILGGQYRTPNNTKTFNKMLQECYTNFKNNL